MERIVYHKGTPYTVTYDDADHEMLSGWNSWCITFQKGQIKTTTNYDFYISLHRTMQIWLVR